MSKFYGAIGYAVTEESRPGVWGRRLQFVITTEMLFGILDSIRVQITLTTISTCRMNLAS